MALTCKAVTNLISTSVTYCFTMTKNSATMEWEQVFGSNLGAAGFDVTDSSRS